MEVKKSTMVQGETIANPRRHIRTVPVALARLRPLQRRCPSEKKLKHETNKSLVHSVLHNSHRPEAPETYRNGTPYK